MMGSTKTFLNLTLQKIIADFTEKSARDRGKSTAI
jgi:hypothetical protein